MPYFCLTLVEKAAEINPKQVSSRILRQTKCSHTALGAAMPETW